MGLTLYCAIEMIYFYNRNYYFETHIYVQAILDQRFDETLRFVKVVNVTVQTLTTFTNLKVKVVNVTVQTFGVLLIAPPW